MIAEEILKLLNSEKFQGLASYYDETTLFNVIGAERSENRHSAFLRWFFSTDSSHGLGDKPPLHSLPHQRDIRDGTCLGENHR